MDITSPNSLWRDYDVSALPLTESELTDKTDGKNRVREFYFDGYTTVDGRVRAFIRITENPDPKGVALYLSGAGDGSRDLRDFLFNYGFTVAELDYTGNTGDKPRFSLYPSSLKSCNYDGEKVFEAPDDAQTSCWYIWTCMARRAVMLLCGLYPLTKIYAVGSGIGGSTVYKLGAFDDGLTACATLLNINPEVTGSGNTIINYRAALDNAAYAPFLKKPIFMAVCSNDEDGSFDDMSALAQTTASLSCFRVAERSYSNGINVVYRQIADFFAGCDEQPPKTPQITVKPTNSDGLLYFNIGVSGGEESNVELFAAFCIENPTNRNWTTIKTMSLGDGEYMAHVDVLQREKPVYAFVNVTDSSGNTVSSPLCTLIPKTLGIKQQPTVKRRLIYDGSMGKDVWISPGGGDVHMMEGPYGISGITGDKRTLITFKPGDLLYRAEGDALLQLIVCGHCDAINATVSDGDEEYSCTIPLSGSNDDWQKFTLSRNDFKGANGPLDDWEKVIMFRFDADGLFLISSVLWV